MLSAYASGDDSASRPGTEEPPTVYIPGFIDGAGSGVRITLDGSAKDADGNEIPYSWERVRGKPGIAPGNADAASVVFRMQHHVTEDAELTFQLTVTDERGLAQSAQTPMIVHGTPPFTETEDGREYASPGSIAILDGSGSMGLEGGDIAYSWRQLDGPGAMSGNATGEPPTLAVPNAGRNTRMFFNLVVTDAHGLTDEVVVIVNLVEPRFATYPSEGSLLAVALGQDDDLLMAGSDGTVCMNLLTREDGCIIRSFDQETPARFVAISGWVGAVLTGGEGVAYWWDTRWGAATNTGHLTHFLRHGSNLTAVALSWSGTLALTGGDDGVVRAWTVTTGEQLLQFRHGGSIRDVVVSGDGTVAVTVGDDGAARVWNAATGEPMHVLDYSGSIRAAALSMGYLEYLGGDDIFALTGGDDGTARLWSTSTGELLQTFHHGGSIRAVALSGNGAIVLTGGAEGLVRVWGAATGEQLSVLKNYAGTSPNSLAVSRSGSHLAFINSRHKDGRDQDGRTGAQLWSMRDALAALTAFAGADQRVRPGALVTLDGSGGSNPGNGSLSYAWREQDTNRPVELTGANTATATFTAPAPTWATTRLVTFELTVEDADGQTDTDRVVITVTNEAASSVDAEKPTPRPRKTTWRP